VLRVGIGFSFGADGFHRTVILSVGVYLGTTATGRAPASSIKGAPDVFTTSTILFR
jgi:hypothetical protein